MPASTVTASSAATSLDRCEESSLTALYRAAIGPVQIDRYLPIFERFEANGRAGPGWNRAACLCTLNWMVFRQLWGAALVYVAAVPGTALLLLGLDRLVFHLPPAAALCLWVAFATLAFIVPGVLGDAILYARIRKSMTDALAATATVAEACVMLNRGASSRQRGVCLALANAVLAAAAGGAYVGLRETMSHRVRAAGPAEAPALVAATLKVSEPAAPTSAPPAPAARMAASAPALATPAPTSAVLAPATAAVPTASTAPLAAASRPRAAAATTTTVAATGQRFYINVGLFAIETNARNTYTRLRDAGLVAFTQELDTAKGKRTRVRVGPFDNQSEAQAAAAEIRALQLDAVIFRQ